MQIIINDYKLPTLIGIHPKERLAKQLLLISVIITINNPKYPHTWELNDTVDWELITEILQSSVTKKTYYLVEDLADDLGHKIIELPNAQSVKITIKKPEAIASAKSTAVSIEIQNT